MKNAVAVFGLLALVATGSILADEGRIPIFQPTSITAPGHYVVTRDYSYASGSGIEIAASDVTVDLNGHTITGGACTTGESGVRIATASGALRRISVRNGRIVGGCRGVVGDADNPAGVRIERVEISGTGQDGIRLLNAEALDVLDCHVHDVGWTGIQARGGAAVGYMFSGRISGNVVQGAGLGGLTLAGLTAGEVTRNHVHGYGFDFPNSQGIYLTGGDPNAIAGGNLVEGNSIDATTNSIDDDGIRIDAASPRNLILNNVIARNRYGMFVRADGTRIKGNVISNNTSHGILVGDGGSNPSRNHLEENQLQDNTGASACGINFFNGNGHVFRNNNLRGNTTGVCGGTTGTNTDGGGNVL